MRFNALLLIFMCGILALVGPNSATAQEPVGLFEPVSQNSTVTRSVEDVHPYIVRSRSVSLNPAVLPTSITRSGAVLHLNFFEDIGIDIVLEEIEYRDEEHFIWKGYVLGEEDLSSVTLVVSGEIIIANVRSYEYGHFQIDVASTGEIQVHEIDPMKFELCSVDDSQSSISMDTNSSALRSVVRADSADTFELLVVYTPAARIAQGGTAAIEALIDLAVSEANTAYTASGINSQVNLVHTREVSYTEAGGGILADLNALIDKDDGDLDEIHEIRDVYGADFVSLFVDSGGAGIGSLLTDLGASNIAETKPFSVVVYHQAAANKTLAHEMGHNLGCAHAVGDAGTLQGDGLNIYSHGHRFFGDSTNEYRTIMAYTPGTRIGRFSTPLVNYDGQPLGNANLEDNVLSINGVALVAANWREEVNPLSVTPLTEFNPAGPEGGPFDPISEMYTLTNTQMSASIDWTASVSESWVTLSAFGGTVTAGNDTDLIVTVNSGADSLPKGRHTATVTITDTTNVIVDIKTVTLSVLFYENTFDVDPSWTTGGQWEFGVPLGFGGGDGSTGQYGYPDPTSGYTGSNVYGVNLGGDFTNPSPEAFLTTTAIDLSNTDNTSLSFARWLNQPGPRYTGSSGKVEVSNNNSNWTTVFEITTEDSSGVYLGVINEDAWSTQTYDISAVADDESTVYIRWGYSASGFQFSGWNIDDVQISGDSTVVGPPTDLAEAWVDFAYGGTESGTIGEPFSTIATAVTALKDDGTGVMKIKGDTGDSDGDETPSIDKAMTIQAEGGTVTIGTP